MRLMRALFFLVLLLVLAGAGHAAKAATPDFAYELFEGDFGVDGFRAGLLIKEGKLPQWLRTKGVQAGDLITEIEQGKANLGPTLHADRLETFLKGLPSDEVIVFTILRRDASHAVKAFLPKTEQDPLAGVAPLKGVAEAYALPSRQILAGKKVDLGNGADAYFAGLAQVLLDACGQPSNPSDQAVVRIFIRQFAEGLLTNRARDVASTVTQGLSQVQAVASGKTLGQTLSCNDPQVILFAQGLPKSLHANEVGPDGGPSRFVASCTPWLEASRCACLAKVARGVDPNINNYEYGREVIPMLVQRNPLVGLAIATACGIVRY